MTGSIMHKTHKLKDHILLFLIYLSALFSVLVLVCIIGYVVIRGVRNVNLTFLTTVTSAIRQTTGIAGNIVNTLYIVVLTLLIATPIGIGSAIYLNEYAKGGKLVRLIEFTTETLSGIPSIIFGLFGMVFFGTACGFGYSILTGALTLTIMILPLITRNTQEALRSVPESYRSGALGMGATKWYMIRTILLPSAMPGITSGDRTYCRRVCSAFVYSRQWLCTSENGDRLPEKDHGIRWNAYDPAVSVNGKSPV